MRTTVLHWEPSKHSLRKQSRALRFQPTIYFTEGSIGSGALSQVVEGALAYTQIPRFLLREIKDQCPICRCPCRNVHPCQSSPVAMLESSPCINLDSVPVIVTSEVEVLQVERSGLERLPSGTAMRIELVICVWFVWCSGWDLDARTHRLSKKYRMKTVQKLVESLFVRILFLGPWEP